jgi:hypothetical protein
MPSFTGTLKADGVPVPNTPHLPSTWYASSFVTFPLSPDKKM